VTHSALQHPKLFHFLSTIDEDLAARSRLLGCSFCGGVLHSARYPRKPRGGPSALLISDDAQQAHAMSQ